MRRGTSVAFAGLWAAVILLAGCSPAAPDDETTPSAPASDDWSLSASDLRAEYSLFLDGLAVKYGLAGPIDAEFARFVTATEWASVQVACLEKKGIPAEVNSQGGVTYGDIPAEQGAAQSRASAECEASYPIDPRFNMVLPRKRAEAQYRFLADTVAPCVEAMGYAITPAPSLETWLDEYYTRGRAWDPFSEAATQMQLGGSQLDELYQRCPTISDDVYPPLDE